MTLEVDQYCLNGINFGCKFDKFMLGDHYLQPAVNSQLLYAKLFGFLRFHLGTKDKIQMCILF